MSAEKSATSRRNSSIEWSDDFCCDMRITRNVCRSSAQSTPDCAQRIEAARGVLYSSASSPNESPGPYALIAFPGSFCKNTE